MLMHKRLSIFLDKNKLIYSLKLGSRQNYSTSYTLIHLTETINQLLDQALFSCGIFVDLQNVFNTADYDIFSRELQHYRTRGITSKWFETYLKDRQQLASINAYNLEFVLMPIHKGLFWVLYCFFDTLMI